MMRALVLCLLLWTPGLALAAELTVAAASDLQFALREIAAAYRQKTGHTVKLTFGSSGALAAQIRNGAPFDVFFSADVSYPEALVKANLADGATLRRYARGVLVLWMANGQPAEAAGASRAEANLNELAAPRIVRIAIANPQHAPYGRAAVEALKAAGVYEKVAGKFVLGESVSQAAQFAESGNAQAALLPLALALAPALSRRGHYAEVDRSLYSPLVQAAVVTARAREPRLARDFLHYLAAEGLPLLRRHGFEAPDPVSAVPCPSCALRALGVKAGAREPFFGGPR